MVKDSIKGRLGDIFVEEKRNGFADFSFLYFARACVSYILKRCP
jgi:hypothetical protein